jgi:hypothetical protein
MTLIKASANSSNKISRPSIHEWIDFARNARMWQSSVTNLQNRSHPVLFVLGNEANKGIGRGWEMSSKEAPIGNGIIAVLPALYAWQLYGWLVAIAVFIAVLIPLAAISWCVVLDKMSARKAGILRVAFVLIGFVALGFSAAQICDMHFLTCRNVF